MMFQINGISSLLSVYNLQTIYRDALPCADLDVAIICPLVRPVPGETEPLPATIQSTSGPVKETNLL